MNPPSDHLSSAAVEQILYSASCGGLTLTKGAFAEDHHDTF